MNSTNGAPSGTNSIRFRLYGCTDVGHVREHNEDNFLTADLASERLGPFDGEQVLSPRGAVFGVCDGMGGAAAGEVASQLAVEIIHEKLVSQPIPAHRDDLARKLVEAVEVAGERIFLNARSDRARRGMGTTATIAALMDERLFLAQVGDSRAYLYRGDQLTLVTRDQSLVNQLIEAGQLSELEADTFEHNNIILQALGTAETVQVDLTYVDLRRGDTLLLCSDGLSGMIKADELKQVLQSEHDPMHICRTLIHKANGAGGHDNITVIIVKFEGDTLQPVLATDSPLAYRKYQLAERDKRRDTARPGSLSPTSSSPPVPSEAAVESGLKVGHTVLGMAAVVPNPPTPLASTPPAAPAASDKPDWSARAVGTTLISVLLFIAFLGFWLLR